MERDRTARLRELFDEAVVLDARERAGFLETHCADDPFVRAELVALLAAADRTGGFLAGPDDAPMPEKIGPYRLAAPLGRGGMGVVYRARHETTGGEVALKTVRANDAALLASIRREIEALAAIDHPGVVRIVDVGVQTGLPWYAMQLHQGVTLAEHARTAWRCGSAIRDDERGWWTTTLVHRPGGGEERAPDAPPLPIGSHLKEMLTLVRRLCPTLAYLHGEGILHRDLKPANVLVLASGRPLLIDFGLTAPLSGGRAREALEAHGVGIGTVAYMAPEQAAGGFLDARTDLYALGCILHELLTGVVPLPAASASGMIERRLHEDPLPPSALAPGIPEVLDRLVLGLLARDRAQRIGHADAVSQALAEAGAEVDPEEALAPRAKPYLYRPQLSGRDEVLGSLIRQLPRRGDPGKLVLVSGESGVGKTRLVAELAAAALARGLAVMTGECLAPLGAGGSHGLGGAFHPLHRAFEAVVDRCREQGASTTARLVGDRAGVLAPYGAFAALGNERRAVEDLPADAARRRVLDAVADTLLALVRDGPLCLLLDDLQWADELTLDLLALLAGSPRLTRAPLLVVGTLRTDEASPALARLAEATPASIVHLGRLDRTGVSAIVSDMLALSEPPRELCDHVAIVSGGNPFFAAEYLRSAVSAGLVTRDGRGRWVPGKAGSWGDLGLPRSVEAMVRERLDRLPKEAREVAEAASVMDRTHRGELLLQVSGLDERTAGRALALLLAREVLEQREGELRFVHHKLREIAYASLAASTRRARHRAAAVALEAHVAGRRSIPHEELGRHWQEAEEGERARASYLAGAEDAVETFAYEGAERLYRAYLALIETISPEAVAARSTFAYSVLGRRGRIAEAEAEQRRALADARGIADRGGEVLCLHHLGIVLGNTGRWDEARRCYEEALPIARETGRRLLEGALVGSLANIHKEQGLFDEAWVRNEQALAIFRELGHRRLEGATLGNLAIVRAEQGRVEEARTLYEEAVAIARARDNRTSEGLMLGNLANLHVDQGRMEEAATLYEQALAALREAGYRRLEGVMLGNVACWYLLDGATERARELAVAGRTILAEVGDTLEHAKLLCTLGHIAAAGGESPAAELGQAQRVAAELAVGAGSELGRYVGKLERARAALASGQPLIRGFAAADLTEGQRRWLRTHHPSAIDGTT